MCVCMFGDGVAGLSCVRVFICMCVLPMLGVVPVLSYIATYMSRLSVVII